MRMPTTTRSRDVEVDSTSSRSTWLASALHRGLAGWVAILLLASLIIRGGAAVNTKINVDEFHFLHQAWMVGHGYLPYRDFWTNKPPLTIYGLRPLIARYDEDPSSLLLDVRLLAWAVNLGLFGLVAWLAAKKGSWTAGLLAALFLSVNLTVYDKTIHLRHESLTLICELFALRLLARGFESPRSREVLGAGVVLGLALALSPKGLFGLSALIISPSRTR
jgi:hypothetical protein